MPTTIGVAYRPDRDIADVAKQVRAEIKRYVSPAVKVSVTIHRYSMGRSLNVLVKACPFKVWDEPCKVTQDAQKLREQIEALITPHKWEWTSGEPDDSYHANFFHRVEFANS